MFIVVAKNDNNNRVRNVIGKIIFFSTEESAILFLNNHPRKNKLFLRKAISKDYKRAGKRMKEIVV